MSACPCFCFERFGSNFSTYMRTVAPTEPELRQEDVRVQASEGRRDSSATAVLIPSSVVQPDASTTNTRRFKERLVHARCAEMPTFSAKVAADLKSQLRRVLVQRSRRGFKHALYDATLSHHQITTNMTALSCVISQSENVPVPESRKTIREPSVKRMRTPCFLATLASTGSLYSKSSIPDNIGSELLDQGPRQALASAKNRPDGV